jgi:hypothetical protein
MKTYLVPTKLKDRDEQKAVRFNMAMKDVAIMILILIAVLGIVY